jgi:N-sulfoglucosamine sulfohydrolase
MRKYADAAAGFIKASDQPFFLAVNFPDAHFPLLRQQYGLPEKPLSGDGVSPLPFIGVDTPRLRKGAADYYNCLMRLDAGVGMLLEELDEARKADQTLVIYIGDHGAQFSRGKATCYEGGLRIPMIVRWPGPVRPGTVRNELVSTIDILPTVIQAAGLPARASLPGRSLLPLAADRDVPWREYLFAERTAYHAASFFPQRTVRDERYKLILNLTPARANPVAQTYLTTQIGFFLYGTNRQEIDAAPEHIQQAYATWRNPPSVELYDLHNDPWEFRNLSEEPEFADVKRRMLGELKRFREQYNDPLLDSAKLKKLAAEHDRVSKHEKGGRYGKGQSWKYLEYLQDGKDLDD